MTNDLLINTTSFGKTSDKADSLVIEISSNSIEFCEMSSTENKPLWVVNYPLDNGSGKSKSEQLITALTHFQFAKKKFNNVLINYFTTQFTLCPVNFYSKDNLRSLLEFNVGSVSEAIIQTDDITHDIKLIYAIDEEFKSTMDNIFPNHHLKHSLTVLTKLMMSSDELTKENLLFSIHADHIEVTLKQDNKLILANQYSIKVQEDVLYYILFI